MSTRSEVQAEAPFDTRRFFRITLGLTIGIAALRVALVLVNYNTDVTRVFESDTAGYLNPALSLARDLIYQTAPGSPVPEWLRMPGYPMFLAPLLRLSGEDLWLPLATQAAVSALSVPLVMATARRLGMGLRWCVVAGIIVGLEPFQLATSGLLVTEALATVLLALYAYVAVRMVQAEYAWPWGLLLGATIAANTYVRPATFYFPLLLIGTFVVLAIRLKPQRRRLLLAGAVAVVSATLLVGIWNVRNQAEFGSWRPTTTEAIVLYWYRAASIVADQRGIPFDPDGRALVTRQLTPSLSREEALDYRRGDVLPPEWEGRAAEYYDRATSRAIDVFAEDPVPFVEQTVRGVYSQVVSSGWDSTAEVFGIDPLPGVVSAAGVLVVLLLEALALVGGVVSLLRAGPRRQASVWLLAMLLYLVVANAGYQAVDGHRFRAPLLPLIAIFAVIGASTLLRAWRSRAAPEVGAAPS